MVDFVCVSSRILIVKFKFEKIKVCVVVTYGPSEGNVEESAIFWDNLNDVLDGVVVVLTPTTISSMVVGPGKKNQRTNQKK